MRLDNHRAWQTPGASRDESNDGKRPRREGAKAVRGKGAAWSEGLAVPESRKSDSERVRHIADEALARLAADLEKGSGESLKACLVTLSSFKHHSLDDLLIILAEQPKGPEPLSAKGSPYPSLNRLVDFMASIGMGLEHVDTLRGAKARTCGPVIQIVRGLTVAEEFSVLAHELAQEVLLWRDRELADDKRRRDAEAEAVAYAASNACGLPARTAAKDFVALYRGDPKSLASSLQRIQETASEILGWHLSH